MKYQYSKDAKAFKLQKALQEGDVLTAADAKKRFGIGNISAEVSRVRQNGYAVYGTTRTAGNGVVVREYHMGKPSREIVALGYMAKSMGISL